MKKIIFIVVFSCLSNVFYAQNIPFTIQKSDVFKDEYKESQIVLSEEDENGGVIIVRSYEKGFSKTKGFYIEQYDSGLKLIKEKEYEVERPLTHKQTTVLGVFTMDKEVKFIEMFYDIKEKAYLCMVISFDTINFNSETKELFRLTNDELKQFGGFSLSDILNENDPNYSLSNGVFLSKINNDIFTSNPNLITTKQDYFSNLCGKNSGLVLIVNKEKNTFVAGIDLFSKNNETLKLYSFDSKLNKKTEHIFKREIEDTKYIFQNMVISNDGNSIFLLSKCFTKQMIQKDNGGKYIFEIVKFSENREEIQTIDPKEHFIGSLKPILIDNRLICIGFYSDIKDNKYKGVCYFELDSASLQSKISKFNPFTEQFIIDKYGNYKDKELKYLKFKNFLEDDHKDLVFNAEESYITHSAGSSGPYGGGSPSQIIYHFDDIVSVKINSEGDLIWARNINKKQTGYDYSSYASILKDNKPYFFINSKEKTKELSDNRIEFRGDKNLNIIRINQKGDFDYQKILDDDENEIPFMVSKGIGIDNSVYFLGRRGKNKQLLKVTL